jgi:hypothetical protein
VTAQHEFGGHTGEEGGEFIVGDVGSDAGAVVAEGAGVDCEGDAAVGKNAFVPGG